MNVKERILIKLNDRIIPLPVADIAYFYSENKTNYVVMSDSRRYIIDMPLTAIDRILNPENFFRISRRCIISMRAIESIIRQQGGRLRVAAAPKPPFGMNVSRSRADEFLAWLER